MKVFIFGAGASRGAFEHDHSDSALVAPLVDELFETRYDRHATSILEAGDLDECRQGLIKYGSVEKWLTERWERVQRFEQPSSQQSERAFFGRISHYVRRLLQWVSNAYNDTNAYATLLRKLVARDERFGSISFNYDTLLDRAYSRRLGRSFDSFDAYSEASYVKPHGSVNWLIRRSAAKELQHGRLFDHQLFFNYATSSMFNCGNHGFDEIRVIDPDHRLLQEEQEIYHYLDRDYFYPALYMPLTVKLYPFIEGFYERVVTESRKMLNEATDVYLVGYRAADPIIQDIFRGIIARQVTLHVVGRDDSAEVMNTVLAWSRDHSVVDYDMELKRGEVSGDGFWAFAQQY
ncbi:MAG: hypothetical protein HZB53_03340 [Chloroflexi bacterium]|nr:hypothetical protein [Chloroflexota bacterium]